MNEKLKIEIWFTEIETKRAFVVRMARGKKLSPAMYGLYQDAKNDRNVLKKALRRQLSILVDQIFEDKILCSYHENGVSDFRSHTRSEIQDDQR